MKVLIATKETQGRRMSDFFWTKVGELLTFGSECDGNETLDGGCGCQRSMVGIETLAATTTMQVEERPAFTPEMLYVEIAGRYERGGWAKLMDPKELDQMIREDMRCLDLVCAAFPVGTILEKRGNDFVERRRAS